jgi:putative UDP-N-acetylmuramyl tripeptide synthetase
MKDWFSIKLGRAIQVASRLYGGGSALPGLVLEKLNPDLVGESLQELPYGVVVVSGTNGKTTTTKALVSILEGQGLKVFTNKTGSNFMRGVASAWLASVDAEGHLDADIAVLELDEAHAVHFINQILPSYCLLLNVMRDQLDRFGELDNVTAMLAKIADKTTKTVVLNSSDGRLVNLGQTLEAELKSHDTSKTQSTTKKSKSRAKTARQSTSTKQIQYFGLSPLLTKKLTNPDQLASTYQPKNSVTLSQFQAHKAELTFSRKQLTFRPKLDGLHNQLNLTGAVATARAILGEKLNYQKLIASLEALEPAFGRGEALQLGERQIKLILVKNPAGFQASLATLDQPTPVLIAINDNYADGRDVSWLWDVDFSQAKFAEVHTTGSRSADMALRLKYDDITATHQPYLRASLESFINETDGNVVIFATYTAMLKLRQELLHLIKKETRK